MSGIRYLLEQLLLCPLANCETAYGKLRGALDDATGRPETLAVHFQSLVDRADALSKGLEQEVQLVIAAAAVQVRDNVLQKMFSSRTD